MNETVERLKEIQKYYRRPGGQSCNHQNADMKCIKALSTAIKALELLPELVEALEFTLTQCEHTTKEIDDKITELIQKAKGVIAE